MNGEADAVSGQNSPEERLEILEDEGVVTIDDEDVVTLTMEFESTRGIYHDSYADVEEAEYHKAVSDVFGIDPGDAGERLDDLGVTREQFIALLALNSHVDGEYPLIERAHMAMMITGLAPPSPVPGSVAELDDDSYGTFLDEHDRVAVTVWKRFCAPCRKMKEELDGTLAAFPDDVAVAGVDGESTPGFCRTFGVEAAPSVLLFEDGELVETLRGYQRPETIESVCAEVYDDR
ncbi:MAG: thioredoxin family protein [Halobacteriota archaeon]|uniref:thioredoxin family protein n=1 Tax=Natronomonas sp. TaxID=2184060 RepID=UPI003974A5F0